jgi:hypothetical protein
MAGTFTYSDTGVTSGYIVAGVDTASYHRGSQVWTSGLYVNLFTELIGLSYTIKHEMEKVTR